MSVPKPPPITVALVGNPNCGKTTILNKLAKTKENVGNYPRVTVAIKRHRVFKNNQEFVLVDLPGVYALTTQTPEESASRTFIQSETADIIVNILDAGNLERSLFLSSQLIEMGRPTLFILNMIDEALKKNLEIDSESLSNILGGPVLKVNGITGVGLEKLLTTVMGMVEQPQTTNPDSIQYDEHLETAIQQVQTLIQHLHPNQMDDRQSHWLAIKLLEGDDALLHQEGDHRHLMEMVRRARYDLARDHGDACEMLFADARFGFIHGLLAKVVKPTSPLENRYDLTRKLDTFFLHKILGIPLFVALLWLMFHTTFALGEYPMNWIDQGVLLISDTVKALLPTGMVRDLVVDGIIAGVGGTIVFLPNIVILFFFMAMFSETGYLTRAAFLMDQVMHAFGLHGKALIPLVVGFGCNVPAIMATRTIESDRSRLITILINPFMLCAARLPVFILFAGAFFSETAGSMVFLMYMLSVIIAMGAAVILNKIFPQNDTEAFIMELPPYRLPTLRAVLIHMWDKAMNFLQKIAGIILVGSIVIWFLQEFPKNIEWNHQYDKQLQELQTHPHLNANSIHHSDTIKAEITRLKQDHKQEALSKSYLGQIAHFVAPLFKPLGFTWKDTVAILTGLVAKEVVVASYAVLYSQDEESTEESTTLREVLGQSMPPLIAFAFMVFTLLYSPCLATIATIRREAGGWRWAGLSIAFSLVLAWSLAFSIVSIGSLFA